MSPRRIAVIIAALLVLGAAIHVIAGGIKDEQLGKVVAPSKTAIKPRLETPWLALGTDTLSIAGANGSLGNMIRYDSTYVLPLQGGDCLVRTFSMTLNDSLMAR